MNQNSFIKIFVWFFFLVSCFYLLGQDRDSLTLPREVDLNERQPPDLVLKTIGIEPGMIIGEVGAGRGRAGYDLLREETFLPKDNIYFLK